MLNTYRINFYNDPVVSYITFSVFNLLSLDIIPLWHSYRVFSALLNGYAKNRRITRYLPFYCSTSHFSFLPTQSVGKPYKSKVVVSRPPRRTTGTATRLFSTVHMGVERREGEVSVVP